MPVPVTAGELTRRDLVPGVWVITHEKPWPANSLVYRTRRGDVVLAGTPYTPAATAELLDMIAAAYPGAAITAINPHFHYDGAGGNAVLVARGIPVLGSDRTAELMESRGSAVNEATARALARDPERAAVFRSFQFVPPSSLFPLHEPQRLRIGGETVEIFFPGPAHSTDNVVVWFPRRRVLFGGCMVRTGGRLGNLSDADVAAWGDSVARLRRFDARFVIPGHGLEFTPSLIEETERAAREAAR
ncbi:MAG TPA: MBL fold metallo-hydrolase [Thermoanaerobaculia bacterium]|nr:MBL fold metallo-hydrolase [Thermoanaerobaculia bacterium]